MNVHKESFKKLPGFTQAPASLSNENERKKKKRLPRQKFCGRKVFIRLYQKTGSIDFNQLWDIDSSNNEGTNSLVNG